MTKPGPASSCASLTASTLDILPDKQALEDITRGRALAEDFTAVGEGRAIYERAILIAPGPGIPSSAMGVIQVPPSQRISRVSRRTCSYGA